MAETTRTSKSRIIRDALSRYLDAKDGTVIPFDLGKDLFGQVGSGKRDLSANYKKILKEKLDAKHAR
jgi:hypothetical protein